MVALRDSRTQAGFKMLAPRGQVLGEPRFRWRPLEEAWVYRVELDDHLGRPVARGWIGTPEIPLAFMRDAEGRPPELHPGDVYRWRVVAYHDRPDGEPYATGDTVEFVFLGP